MKKVKVSDIRTKSQVAKLPDQELLQLHHRLHQLYGGARERGEATEYPYVNVHIWVVEEMERRGMNHNIGDELDRETEALMKRATPEWVDQCLKGAEDSILIPAYVSLVGSATTKEDAQDVDILIREDEEDLDTGWRESVMLLVRKLFDPLKKRGLKLHILGNPQGPHLAPGQGYIPVFDLVLRPRKQAELVTKSASEMPGWRDWLKHAPDGKRIDLGPGEEVPEGFEPLGRPYDLDKTWPLEPDSVAVLRANHVLEHLRDVAHTMNEAWRVLMPGGLFIITVPEASSAGAVAHPEHHTLWNADSFHFWTNPDLLRTIEHRTPGAFELLHLEARGENGLRYVDAVLRKPALAKRALAPIVQFTLPKPSQKGYAHTDAFSPGEIWPWVQRHLESGVVAEPKYGGFRGCLQKKGDKVSLYFEDSQQERWDKLSGADDKLKRIEALPDCILDCDIGVIERGKRWPRPRLMALTADSPALPEGAHIIITAFDVLYWDKDPLNEKPFSERRKKLEEIERTLNASGIVIPPEMVIRTEDDLRRAWQSERLGRLDGSEGLVLKAMDWVYSPGPSTDGMAKIKHCLEIKAIVLETKRTKDGQYNFRGGLLPGDLDLRNTVDFNGDRYVDLGFSFNAGFGAEPGDIVTFEVEEIIWDKEKSQLAWLGAKPIDVDKSRSTPYAAKQAIEMAERAGVLQEIPIRKASTSVGEKNGEGGETRGEAALRNWEEYWHEAMPIGRTTPLFILHCHFRGLSEEEANLGLDDLLQTNHSMHFDLRLGTNRFSGWWGISLFAGTNRENRDKLRIFKMMDNPDEVLESAPKQFGPPSWLRVGLDKPLIVGPGGPGSTSKTYSKFFAIDHGTWQLGMARVHSVEIWLNGKELKGRFMWNYAEVGGTRRWLFTRPEDQRSYVETHDFEDVVKELHSKGQKWLFWPKNGPKTSIARINVEKAFAGLEIQKYTIVKSEKELRYTLGIAYPASRVDAHGDYTDAEQLELAAWKFTKKLRQGRATVGLMHAPGTEDAGEVVESYIYRGPEWEIGDQVVRPGDWLLGVIWNERAWDRIKKGEITGYSIQGMALKA